MGWKKWNLYRRCRNFFNLLRGAVRRVEGGHKGKRNIGTLKIHSESSKDFESHSSSSARSFPRQDVGERSRSPLLYISMHLKWFGDVTSDLHNPFFNFSYPSLSSKAQGIANGKGIIISESYPGNRLSSASFRFVSDSGLVGCGGANGFGISTEKNGAEPPTAPECTKIMGHFEVIEKDNKEARFRREISE